MKKENKKHGWKNGQSKIQIYAYQSCLETKSIQNSSKEIQVYYINIFVFWRLNNNAAGKRLIE